MEGGTEFTMAALVHGQGQRRGCFSLDMLGFGPTGRALPSGERYALDSALRSIWPLVVVHHGGSPSNHRLVPPAGGPQSKTSLVCDGRRAKCDDGGSRLLSHASAAGGYEFHLRCSFRCPENCLDRARRGLSLRHLGRDGTV